MTEKIKEALLDLNDNVYQYTAKGNQKVPYIVYGTDGENHLFGSDVRAERCDTGYIDLFTRQPRDVLIEAIPDALEAAGAAFYLTSVQQEAETGLLHYEWRWEAV